MNNVYKLPQLQLNRHKFVELTGLVEDSGFNLIREDNISGKTEGVDTGVSKPEFVGRSFSGNYSFVLNESKWLMYERDITADSIASKSENKSLRDVVFLSEHKDFIVKRNDSITQSQNALDCIALQKFLKNYDSTNRILKSRKVNLDYIGSSPKFMFDLLFRTKSNSEIDDMFTNSKYKVSPYTYIGAGVIASVIAYAISSTQLYSNAVCLAIGGGSGLLVGGYAYLGNNSGLERIRKGDKRSVENVNRMIRENNYLFGNDALEYIKRNSSTKHTN